MITTYRSSVFACFYLGILLFVAAVWFFLPEVPAWGAAVLIALGLLGLPFVIARVEIGDEGITQQIFRGRTMARWADVISWERVSHPDSDGPDTISIKTRVGSFTINHNCVYGKRLDSVEAELRRRVAQQTRSNEPGDGALVDSRGSSAPGR